MLWRFPLARWQVFACVLVSLISAAVRAAAYQQPDQAPANAIDWTATEEKDSDEIYSMLLQTEFPQSKVTEWAITQQTQTFPGIGSRSGDHVRECLNVPRVQESAYLPLIQDYIDKNRKPHILERKFSLSPYSLIEGRNSGTAGPLPGNSITFHVSAVGFNREGTRALVYVGHYCGSLCGGGGYHLLVKMFGVWSVDREFRGMSCRWVS
jgi:hypothetical protein